jgi:hypothetical protein
MKSHPATDGFSLRSHQSYEKRVGVYKGKQVLLEGWKPLRGGVVSRSCRGFFSREPGERIEGLLRVDGGGGIKRAMV